ncbi:MAG: peptidoglycan DD-metalloendopeptidase family protein [Acidimicrobiia bacterium]|nr:peptidoglycan DD-metalloendopeptidase family protein [Acidimicrobiia bacterium]
MKRALLFALVLVLAVPGGVAGAYDLNDDLADVNRRINAMNAEIASANSSRTSVVADIVETRDALAIRQAELAATEEEIATTEDAITDQQRSLDILRFQLQQSYQTLAETRIRLDDSKDRAREWVRAAYIGSNSSTETIALSAESLTSVYVGLQYLDYLAADTDRAMLEYESLQTQEVRQQELIKADEAEVGLQIADLDAIKADLDVLAATQLELAEEVAAELSALTAKLDAVDATIAEFEDELDGLEAEQARVEQLIQEEASREGEAPGVLVRPVPGAISSTFGMRLHPILGYFRMHSGVDFRAGYGQEIKAAGSGRVILAGGRGGYGNTIIIDHGGGMTTLYAHQSSFNVGYGDQVSAGEIIGYVGSSGLSTGPHLHFEVRIGGRAVDPLGYL